MPCPCLVGEDEAGLLDETAMHVVSARQLLWAHREAALLLARGGCGAVGGRPVRRTERMSAARPCREAEGRWSVPLPRAHLQKHYLSATCRQK
jgi:hypothetical protein